MSKRGPTDRFEGHWGYIMWLRTCILTIVIKSVEHYIVCKNYILYD